MFVVGLSLHNAIHMRIIYDICTYAEPLDRDVERIRFQAMTLANSG